MSAGRSEAIFCVRCWTGPLVKIRVLGKSEGPKLEPRLILFATGNNLSLIGDISRRAVIAHLPLERDQIGSLVSPELHGALMAVAAAKAAG
jgi:hypothetical protein